jgi:hypothetical protein
MVTWKENIVNESDKTEGCDHNNSDDGSICLVSECGQVRSCDSEDDTTAN